MGVNTPPPRILFPRTAGEAVEMAILEPDAKFWAGGTALTNPQSENKYLKIPRVLIAITLIEELARASHSEQGLEIGASINLDRLKALGHNCMPPGFTDAVMGIGTLPVRSRATLGGHLAMTNRIGDLRPFLQIMDSSVEICHIRQKRGRRRTSIAFRHIPVAGLNDPDEGLQPGSLITRIRIPTGRWNCGQFVKIYPHNDDRSLVFCAVARIEKNLLMEFRLAFTDTTTSIFRDAEFEASLAGRNLPLNERDIQIMQNSLKRLTKDWAVHSYKKDVVSELTRGFFARTSDNRKIPLSFNGSEHL